jgi:hypothetical protein
MISRKFTVPFTIWRQEWSKVEVGDTIVDRSAEAAVDIFSGYRQQASLEYVQDRGLAFSKPHIIWCAVGTEVFEGDTIGSQYGFDKVRAKQINADGNNRHIELLVEHIGQENPGS